MKISVIVTNWNGINLLKKYFLKQVETSPEAQEIIFADDSSTDESVKYISELQKTHPKIKILTHKKNVGFGQNTNDAVKLAKGDLVVFLNNDLYPHQNYLKASIKHFKDPKVFGVSFAEEGNENWAKIFWKSGYLQYEPGQPTTTAHISGWVSGGSSIISKKIFTKLGGFDAVYAPFYSEDLDIGYRAWKSGYTLLWEPKSVVRHLHETTMSRFSKNFLNYVKERNRLLTTWRNITDPEYIRQNKFTLIGRCLTGPNYIKIIRAAKKQINSNPPPIVFPKRTDREIFELFK